MNDLARLAVAALVLLGGACSPSHFDSDVAPPPSSPDAGATPDVGRVDAPEWMTDAFPRKALAVPGRGMLVVLERPQSLRQMSLGPSRELVWLDPTGTKVLARRSASPGRALLDATVHPSGAVTALTASDEGFALARYDANATLFAEHAFVDPKILDDPPRIHDGESRSPIETHTHDVGRLDADGEGVVLATRTGRHSVVAYRVRYAGESRTFVINSRALVVPAHPLFPVGLTGGTYDTFAQLEAHYAVHVARAAERTFVAVQHARAEGGAMKTAHEEVFGEKLATDPDALDIFVTRLSADGRRLGTTVVTTPNDDQPYGLRAVGKDAYAIGRTEHWNERGTGFDALVARVAEDGTAYVREIDVDRGDIAFDVSPAPDGGVIVAGASGYWQNPRGASISEESSAFALWLRADGKAQTLLDTIQASGPERRHNEARFVVGLETGQVWIGGMQDGPGTHSADQDPSLLRVRGFGRVAAM